MEGLLSKHVSDSFHSRPLLQPTRNFDYLLRLHPHPKVHEYKSPPVTGTIQNYKKNLNNIIDYVIKTRKLEEASEFINGILSD